MQEGKGKYYMIITNLPGTLSNQRHKHMYKTAHIFRKGKHNQIGTLTLNMDLKNNQIGKNQIQFRDMVILP